MLASLSSCVHCLAWPCKQVALRAWMPMFGPWYLLFSEVEECHQAWLEHVQELTWILVFFKGQSWMNVPLSLDVPHSRGDEATGAGSFELQPSVDWFSISRGEVTFLHQLCSSYHNWLQSDWGGSFLSKVFATQAGGPRAYKTKTDMVVCASNPRAMEATTEGACGSLAS